MIYITGDCHCDFVRFNTENFPEQKEMTKDDYVLICGDFGGVWDKDISGKTESWWAQEIASEEEMEEGRRNLAEQDNCVDFIVTHCCSSQTQAILGEGMYMPDELTEYFQELRERVQFKTWFFGHYHDNRTVNAEEILLYEQIIRIA